ncbi:GL15657 [Drosophila persimilis]|uniref:GL15657 n=1 Tax=Drosophila persimilis TaxID=7234 RepID=B4HA50_DROPE|nr:GL15657 [Drosophila persimilis]
MKTNVDYRHSETTRTRTPLRTRGLNTISTYKPDRKGRQVEVETDPELLEIPREVTSCEEDNPASDAASGMSLTLLQINLHHCKGACAALLLHLAQGGVDIVLIQEP